MFGMTHKIETKTFHDVWKLEYNSQVWMKLCECESESVCVTECLRDREAETRAHNTERQRAQQTVERRMRES